MNTSCVCINICIKSELYKFITQGLQNPVRQTFSYVIRHIFIAYSALNHNENMLYPALKSCSTEFRKLCNNKIGNNIYMEISVFTNHHDQEARLC